MGSTAAAREWRIGDAGDVPKRWSREKKIEALRPVARLLAGKAYRNKLAVIGLELDDVEMFALYGIIKAVDTYKPDRGLKLRHFAALCGRAEVITRVRSVAGAHRRQAAEADKYVAWLSLEAPCEDGGDGGEQTMGDMLADMADVSADTEMQALGSIIHQDNVEEALAAARLTKLETSVFLLWLTGMDYAEIAKQSGRNQRSVDNALQRAMLGMRDRSAPKMGDYFA